MTITDFGVAVVEGDSHLSKWIIEQRRLEVQDEYCHLFSEHIPNGGIVADIGACLGDHTVSYSRMVGERGTVHAFEPNPVAFQCLAHNLRNFPNVRTHRLAIGLEIGTGKSIPSETQPENLGARWFESDPDGEEIVVSLDTAAQFWTRLDFVKIDVEGMELDVLAGGSKTIKRLRPVMLIEVNRPVLARRGHSAEQIFNLLEEMGYSFKPSEPHILIDSPELDVLALPK